MADRVQGKIKWFSEDKGYGFIEREDGGEDVFLHYSELKEQRGFKTIEEGARVEFEVEPGPKGPKAANVERV
ncbi:MAG: cold-shock protein [Persicimonas sp.]